MVHVHNLYIQYMHNGTMFTKFMLHYVFVILGSTIICQLYELTLSDQTQVTL
jgi:hypothetical protein